MTGEVDRRRRARGAGNPLFPAIRRGHWQSPEGRAMAERYADMDRSELFMPDITDLELANSLFLAEGDIHIQTAAKERMRWLSTQLALAEVALEEMVSLRETLVQQVKETGTLREAASRFWLQRNELKQRLRTAQAHIRDPLARIIAIGRMFP